MTTGIIDLNGKTLLTSSGLWTIRLREPVSSDASARSAILKIDVSCGDRWHLVDLHVDGAAHFVQHRGISGWILDALHGWLTLPDVEKMPTLLLGPTRT